jgi:hypothetical protein
MIRNSRWLSAAILLMAGGLPLAAQAPTEATVPGGGRADPMSCWWKTDKSAVRIGEPFGLTLSCRILETEPAAVVPTVSEIEPTSIQLAPFDVLGGTRHEDLVAPPWRYFQYDYRVRLLGEEFFGRDVAIPPTNVTFRVRTGGADAIEGTEHTYVLPALPIRILSLLPVQAADIRDPSIDTFGDIESRRFRATAALVAGALFFAFAAVLLAIAGVRALERFRRRGPVAEASLPSRTVLNACVREIDHVRAEAAREGWSPALAGRVLTPLRIAAAVGLSQPVTQKLGRADTPAREGQLAIRHGLLRRRGALVSAPMTGDAVDRLLSANGNGRPATHRALDQIREVLTGISAFRYGRNGHSDGLELDRMLDTGSTALRRLRAARRWHGRAAGALANPASLFGTQAWRR